MCLCVQVGQMSCVRYFTDVTTEALSRQLFVDSDKLIYIVDGQSVGLSHWLSSVLAVLFHETVSDITLLKTVDVHIAWSGVRSVCGLQEQISGLQCGQV